jgi:pimeloyl-ACP methyl ester carboxylesterase
MIRRCFIDVAGRAVHYRRAGSGPPLVMMHGSPGDAQMLLEEITVCAQNFTVFALDAPGFGYSDALPGDVLTVPDLAAATAETMRALGLPPCPVYGSHTGAAIALELGLGWPEQVTGLLLEGVPAFTADEIEALFATYFAPMVPDPLAGHLTTTWMRFRDQFTWFPWTSRHVSRLNAIPRPDPADIDLWVSMFYRSCKTYRPAYRAACYYGPSAIPAAAALRAPAVFMAQQEDMLHPHLARLPPLQPNQRIETLPSDMAGKTAAILRFAEEFATTAPAPPHRQMATSKGRYVDGPDGQIFTRLYGNPASPPVVLLHGAPGTSLSLHEAATALAATHYVVVPDQPGCGLTEAPASEDILAVAADNVLAVTAALTLGPFTVGAAGSAVAALLSQRPGLPITKFLVTDTPPRDPALVAPPIPFSPTGAHWLQAWLMVRDGEIYNPWYDGRVAAQRLTQGHFDAGWLHDQTVALMEGRATYHLFAQAAASTAAKLAAGPIPVIHLPEDAFSSGFHPGVFS